MPLPRDEAALLSGVWSADDDTPWLVLADFYQERGDPLGEHVREWVTKPRTPASNGSAFPDFDRNRPAVWMLLNRDAVKRLSFDVRRSHPHVDLHNGALGNTQVRVLGTCPLLAGARSLSLSYNRLTGAALDELVASPFLKSLESLDLSWNNLGAEGATLVAGSDAFPSLRELDLSYCVVPDAGVRAICESPSLGDLTRLNLEMNPFRRDLRDVVRQRFRTAVLVF